MPTTYLRRGTAIRGTAFPAYAPIYVDSDDDICKVIPAGSGTTEVELVDSTHTQTISGNKTFTGTVAFTGSVNPVEFADGTAAAPSITFSSDLDCGFYRIGADNVGFALGGAIELNFTTTAFSPGASDGNALGTTSLMWSDLFLASGGVINFNAGNVTITHAAGQLTIAGNVLASNAAGPAFVDEAATSTNPTLCPDKAELDTGIGWASDTLHFVLGGANEVQVTTTAFSPGTSDGNALGTTSLMWADLFLASGGVINWAANNVTITHSTGSLTFAGGSSGYQFDALVIPTSNDAGALGSGSLSWSDLFLASGAVVNFANGNVTITHGTGTLSIVGAITTTDSGVVLTKAATEGLRIGDFVVGGATGSAVPFSTGQNIYSDGQVDIIGCYGESDTNLTSAYSAKCGRFRHIVNCTTAEHETYGAVGQLVIKDTTLTHLHAGLMGTFEGHTSGVVANSAYTVGHACVTARLGGHAAITATTPVAGFLAFNNGSAALASGSAYAFATSCVNTSYKWSIGLYMSPLAQTRGVSIGAYSSTVGDGLPASGATWLNGFFSDVAADLGAGVRRNLIARTYFNYDQTTAAADYDVIRGHLKAASGIDFSGDTSVKTAIHGYCEHAGATTIGAGSFYAAVLGEFWSDNNLIGTGLAGAVMARIYGAAGTAQTTVAGMLVCKQWASVQTFTHGVYIQDGSVATGGDIRLQGGATISSGTAEPTHTATQGSIYLRTGQNQNATLYINTNGATTWTLCNALT